MRKIDKNNYEEFLKIFNDFHDGYVKKIDYDTDKSEVCILFDVCSNCLKKNEELKMVFKGVDNFTENNPYMINYIDYVYIDFFHRDGKKLICFSLNSEDPDEEPYLYVLCKNIEYEEGEGIK